MGKTSYQRKCMALIKMINLAQEAGWTEMQDFLNLELSKLNQEMKLLREYGAWAKINLPEDETAKNGYRVIPPDEL